MEKRKGIATRQPMAEDAPDAQDRLEFLAARQRMADGQPQYCPRCGQPDIKPKLHTNALSRHFRIYICDACGNQEALLQSRGRRLPFREWAAAAPGFRVEIQEGSGAQ